MPPSVRSTKASSQRSWASIAAACTPIGSSPRLLPGTNGMTRARQRKRAALLATGKIGSNASCTHMGLLLGANTANMGTQGGDASSRSGIPPRNVPLTLLQAHLAHAPHCQDTTQVCRECRLKLYLYKPLERDYMEVARGSINQNVDPLPGVLSTPTSPPCRSMRVRQIYKPNPRLVPEPFFTSISGAR